jgi:hypothetical protein
MTRGRGVRMTDETIVAIVAAGIALLAMGVAIWQAVEARRSGQSAKRQAELAEVALAETKTQTKLAEDANTQAMLAVKAAERAAKATEDQEMQARQQVRIAHEQFRLEQAARDEQAAPLFELKPRRRRNGVHLVIVRRTGGPEEIRVHAVWSGLSEAREAKEAVNAQPVEIIGGLQAGTSGPHYMLRNSTFEIPVVVPGPTDTVTVHVTLECHEEGRNERTWVRMESLELKRPPQVYVN